MSWVQFSESSDFSAGDGLALTGSVFSLDINNMTPATIALGDEIAFNDITGDTPQNTTVENMFKDLNVPYGITGTGIMVQTADDTYIKRSIDVDGAGALDGLAVANADGTGGNPTIGLDIDGMVNGPGVEAINSADKLAVYNVSTGANMYYTVNDIANAGAANGFGSIVTDVGTATADAPTDPVTFTGDGIGIIDTSVTTTASVQFALDISDLTTIGVGTIALANEFGIDDGTAANKRATFTDMVTDLQIPNAVGTGVGFLVSNGAGAYTTRTISASADEDELGIAVNTTDGTANLTIGLDIVNLTNPVEDMAATDEFAVHNKSEGTDGANRKMTGQEIADGTATILGITDLTFSTINGQAILTYADATRVKTLSTDSFAVTFSENKVGNNDWVNIAGAIDATSGFIIPLNATVVGATMHTANNNGNTKNLDLYVDGVSTASILTVTGAAGEQEDRDETLNIDVNQDQKVRIRGDAAGGTIEDTVVTLWLRWRA
jgi:hypothetical protein